MGLEAKDRGRPLRVLISAGEASGEMYGAALLAELRMQAANNGWQGVECFGLGGEKMRQAGVECIVDANRVAVLGLFEVVSHLPSLYREFHKLTGEARRRKPDVAVLIDFPDWNLRLARELHRAGIPVVYYVSPQIWAWRQRRVHEIRRNVRKMLVIFPFEVEFYKNHGVAAEFVGHPLAEIEPPPPVIGERPMIALLPGSRRKEIAFNLPEMLAAAAHFSDEYCFEMPVASTIEASWLRNEIEKLSPPDSRLNIALTSDSRQSLTSARAALVASGTATVEAAVIGTPFLMVYRLSPLTYALGKRLVKVPFFGMVNLIAGHEAVPELVQDDFRAMRIIPLLEELLAESTRRRTMITELRRVSVLLGCGSQEHAAANAARAVLRVATEG